MTTHTEETTLFVVLTGRTLVKGSKRLHPVLTPIQMNGHARWQDGHLVPEEQLILDFKEARRASPGSVFEIVQVSDSKYRLRQFVGLWPDQAARAQWQADTDTLEAQHTAERREAKAQKQDDVAELVAPLRDIYRRLRGGQRTQFLARVVYLLTR